MKRILSALLLMTMLVSCAASCGDAADDSKDTSNDVSTTTAPVETGPSLDIPDDLKYEDETVTILTAEGILSSVDELTDEIDVLGKAHYERTVAVEERFGIDLEFVGVVPWQDTSTMARQSINAQSDDYQMVFTCASHMINLVNEGLFLSHADLPYIDIEKPWWNKQYIESVSLHEDDQYILFGDITYNTIQRTTCVFFNVNLLDTKLGLAPQDLYDLVYDGKWTIDKFTELVSQVYEDNGDTKRDTNDIFGLIYHGVEPFNWMAFSSGIEFTTRDEDGYPSINVNTATTVDLLDKLCALFFNNEGVIKDPDADGTHQGFATAFGNGKSVFCVNRFFLTAWKQFREMNDDFGILPMPKYDESIDGYHSTVENLVQWGGVPITVADPEMASAVAEALAYESYMRTTAAYYETTLKLKQTRDEASMDMIDMIMDGRDTDYLYINPLNGLGDVFRKVFNAGQNNFASAYASVEMAGFAALEELIETYENR